MQMMLNSYGRAFLMQFNYKMVLLSFGVLSVIFLPLLAAIAIWLYVVVFMFSGLWFQLFCLDALQKLRQSKVIQSV